MFLYYLVDLNEGQPIIVALYFGKESKFTKDELMEQNGYPTKDFEQIVYSKIPITEIFGLENICENGDNKNIYFMYLGDYDFYYAIGNDAEEAINIAHQALT